MALWAVRLLDQLLYRQRVEPEDAEALLAQAESHPREQVREQAAFIRSYLQERAGQLSDL